MSKREIAFKGSFSNGAEHTDYLTIHDNYQGTRRAAVVVDKHAMYSPADIDALIAALREARAALAGDAARDDGAEEGEMMGAIRDLAVETMRNCNHTWEAWGTYRHRCPKCGATRRNGHEEIEPPAPSRATDAAPERAATRLTRAQLSPVDIIILNDLAAGGEIVGTTNLFGDRYIRLPGGEMTTARAGAIRSLQSAGLIAATCITDAGRAALRDAGADDARGGTRSVEA